MGRYLEYSARTVSGFVRCNNEDNFFVDDTYKDQDADELMLSGSVNKESNLLAVCDGMGGEAAGEVASFCAVSNIDQAWKGDPTAFVRSLNRVVLEKSEELGYVRMGSTISFLVQNEENILVGNVGDSRNYRFHDAKLIRTSKDHSKAQLLMDMGLMDEDEAKQSDAWHILMQNLGIDESEALLVPYTEEFEFICGDLYLLCSDGLSDMVSEEQIEEVLSKEQTLNETVDELVQMALNAGGKDNITILLARCAED